MDGTNKSAASPLYLFCRGQVRELTLLRIYVPNLVLTH